MSDQASQVTPFDPSKLNNTQLYVADVLTKKLLHEGLNPDLFVPLAFHESGLRPNAEGPEIQSGQFKGQRAQGLFQYVPDVAKEKGITDPLDFDQNMNGAIKDFKAHIQNPKIGLDSSKLLSAWNAGPHNSYITKDDISGLPDETLNYLLNMHKRVGGELPSPVVNTSVNDARVPDKEMPVPFSNVTPQEALTSGLTGAKAGLEAGAGAQAGLGLKRYIDSFNPNSPASLQTYLNKMLGKQYQDVPIKDLEDLTGRTIVSQHDVQEAVKDVHGRPTYPSSVRVQNPSGIGYKQVPVVDPVAQGVAPTGMSPRIDISQYEFSPGIRGAVQKTVQGALPLLKSAARVAGSALGGAGTALDVQDAINRFRHGDTTGSAISGLGAGLGGLATVGAMGLLAPEIATAAGVGALGTAAYNAGRDLYKMSPTERQQLLEKTKENLRSVLPDSLK